MQYVKVYLSKHPVTMGYGQVPSVAMHFMHLLRVVQYMEEQVVVSVGVLLQQQTLEFMVNQICVGLLGVEP